MVNVCHGCIERFKGTGLPLKVSVETSQMVLDEQTPSGCPGKNLGSFECDSVITWLGGLGNLWLLLW